MLFIHEVLQENTTMYLVKYYNSNLQKVVYSCKTYYIHIQTVLTGSQKPAQLQL